VADTPGLRQVEFWDLPPDDIAWCFPEMSPFVNDCRFANCRHDSEPGCAIKAQLASGKLSEHRYASYLSMIAHKTLS
jgi:ribosome biogenesis GTPase